MAPSPSRYTSRRSRKLPGFFRAGETGRTLSSGSSTTRRFKRSRRLSNELNNLFISLIFLLLPAVEVTIITHTASPLSLSGFLFGYWLLLITLTSSFYAGRYIGEKRLLEYRRRQIEELPGLLESATRPYRSLPCRREGGGSSSTKQSGQGGDEVFEYICHLCKQPIYPEEEFSSNFKGLSEHRFCKVQSIGEDS